MPFPDHLLEQAQLLTNLNQRRPRQASLRRAVSTAYYALFHLLISDACRSVVPGPASVLLRNQIARAFTHREMHIASNRFAAVHAPLAASVGGGATSSRSPR